jgi:hypothetical protein
MRAQRWRSAPEGACEWFPKTVLDEFYRMAFRKKIYRPIDALQADLDGWIAAYNESRPHQGRWCYGKTPMQTFLDAVPIANAKLLPAARGRTNIFALHPPRRGANVRSNSGFYTERQVPRPPGPLRPCPRRPKAARTAATTRCQGAFGPGLVQGYHMVRVRSARNGGMLRLDRWLSG